jgi:hypothetical protein
MRGVRCRYQIILQPEFHLVSGKLIKNNSEEIAQLCRVIYDDDFENIIAIQIMPMET